MADDFCQFFGAMMVKYPVSFCHALETFLHMTLYRYAKVTTWITPKTKYLTYFIHIYSHFNIYHETYDITTFPMLVMHTDASSWSWNPYVLHRQVARLPCSRAIRGFCVHFLKVEKNIDFVMLFKNNVVSLLIRRR